MINIPHTFNGSVYYKSYDEYQTEAKEFPSYEEIGRDSSGNYDMFVIKLGDSKKPPLLITASVHGIEWQSTFYVMEFMKQIRDNTYPDTELRNNLLNNFYLVCIPMVNPWGVDNVPTEQYKEYTSGSQLSYRNSNYVDLNGDFFNFTQQESKNVRDYVVKIKPFATIDSHLFQPDYDVAYGLNAIVASGQQGGGYQEVTEPYVLEWKESMENYIGENITRWTNTVAKDSGLLRAYMARQSNPHAPYTLSYITEIVRPAYRNRDGQDVLIRKLTDDQIYSYGMTHLYLFLKTSLEYYEKYGGALIHNQNGIVTKISTPYKDIEIERDSNGNARSIIETYKTHYKGKIKTTIYRNENGVVQSIDRLEVI